MSNEDDLPSWLNEDLPSTKTSSSKTTGPSATAASQSQYNPPTLSDSTSAAPLPASLRGKKEMVYWGMKGLTVTLCALMSATAVLGILSVNGIDDTGRIMVAIYMILFSSLLAVFEIIQIRAWDTVDRIYRRNFGFLYGTKGKSFFIIFVAFLSFGLSEPANLCMLTGILVGGLGALELTLYLKYPELFEDSPGPGTSA